MSLTSNRKEIVLQIADLERERDESLEQYRSTIDEAQRIRLKRKLEGDSKKIDKLYNLLDKKDISGDSNHRRSCALEEKLPKIDFKEQIETVRNILEECAEDGAVLFLVNDSLNMAGNLFCLQLRKILNDETTDFRYFPISFSLDVRLDEIGFLQRLGDHLGMDTIETEEEYIKIIEKFFCFMENGTIIFIELNKINLLSDMKSFFGWLVNKFWKTLVKTIRLNCEIKDIEQIKFIILAISDTNTDEEYLNSSFFCTEIDFDRNKILAIPLKEWSKKDIHSWLIKYSGLPKHKISSIANDVYKSSNGGNPKYICDALMSTLS
ncbi:hypothetical protein G7B40_030105 [Aetokthonos hydrillicola Thurmond2011]|jgi:hypothetical protein|uniref:Uncharacterized protein n=1 Tax=Aetokthonos hydrillicola Thurmond2011 TaxID=2712845 RepID=A0AAP5IC41_9CYAN|nr:hypothetical protein [Aetokthonos hydrillicola]MBO3459907.1 hypothetical protein [Aetokthonos hydrillicola CCALA 1050]MBW4584024.1 hypothetical protein [Aetokthonos hydrillicola CCALA 1050]MDR9898781.1 hypothetical protein [Aetokthonos hydrillicola Thurmond2011]